ncbi:MAG: carbohydrate kinase [Sphingobacteriia bacterium]|nr:MAG: carbohydrate kinase [Sphingobacteriia bacterium]
MSFAPLFDRFTSLKAVVLGDIMLDTYWWGQVDRISPEAPVPIVALERKEARVGGAANVALNLAALGAKTHVFAVVGEDAEGNDLVDLLSQNGIQTKGILADPDRPTTTKTRIMGRHQQMMRLDAETTQDLSPTMEAKLQEKLFAFLENEKPELLVFEDYNKGVLTDGLIRACAARCRALGIFTAVDPKRKNFLSYLGVDLFKPNLKEVKDGLGLSPALIDLTAMQAIHAALAQVLHHRISLVTLSEKGVFYQMETEAQLIPTHVRNIADVSGAGDTVIAVAALAYVASGKMSLAAEMANIAGGLVCEEVGTAPIRPDRLLAECERLLKP